MILFTTVISSFHGPYKSSCTVDTNYKLMNTKTEYEAVANTTSFNDFIMPSKPS